MSTQDDFSMPFEICNEQQNFRLLELPPSLLELITSRGLSNVSLKSAAFSPLDGSNQAANAVLCTNNQTFQVRQVQSSNSVFVLQPSEGSLASEDDAIPVVVLSAIAQCTATLELVLTSPSAIAILKETLPIYVGPESIPASGYSEKMSRESIYERVPISRGEFNKAWKALCAFELDGRAWIPAASSLTGVWKSVASAATLTGVNLGGGLPIPVLEGVFEEDDHPSALFRAVIERLRPEDEDLMDGHAILDREITVPWVGAVLLESQRNSADGIRISDLIRDWQNHLPEDWRKDARIDMLKGKYSHLSRDRIAFDEGATEASDSQGPAATKASGKGARKWHDKFKNARR